MVLKKPYISTSTKTKRLKVSLGNRSYDILIGSGIIVNAGKLIKSVLEGDKVIIVTDRNVAKLHLKALEKSLYQSEIRYESIILPAGEKTKNFKNLESLANKILASGIERKATLIALGGGVIGDITGFAASVLLRGINFIQIPTTLLAMVDSSVGGKTGINTKYGKNLVGSFYQPKMVLADIGLLRTLPEREFKAGYAEVVKYSLINNKSFFNWLVKNLSEVMSHEEQALEYIVNESCKAKARIVAKDEKEQGIRALLNLGHTFGHALEFATGYSAKLLHGEAVAIGMVLAFEFSTYIGICNCEAAGEVKSHLDNAGLPTEIRSIKVKVSPKKMLELMQKDKKVNQGRLHFILAKDIGKAFIDKNILSKDLLEFLEARI